MIDLTERLLYRDGMMLILNKPAGIAVHAGPSGGPTLEEGFEALRFGLPTPPALAHRLDRDTSGCLVLGRHSRALRRLGRLFAARQVEKVYWAVVQGEPNAATGTIDMPLAKISEHKARWRMKGDAVHGQPAVTDYRVMACRGGLAWLELRPRTGRTHQIRVHCAALGCPVAGDPVYGGGGEPLQLHARAIGVPLYPQRPPVTALAPVPEHMRDRLRFLGWPTED
ncbi:MAG: hypothetical protein FD149_1493 [Rhodospirillaceae bacterium]|nr:MAG: hypothetical protein FD149_1493 [Rhodospirillaceae bacterium]